MEIVTDIQLDPRNYRRHSKENKELIKKSLTECGAGRSILMDNKGQLIAGNGVFEQAKKLNIPTKIVQTDGSELVVVQRTDLAPEDIKRKKLAIMDNSASDSSEFDVVLLVEDFSIEQVKELGVKNPKLEVEQEREIVEDVVPVETEHRVKPGDIWQLGRHRLICADSTGRIRKIIIAVPALSPEHLQESEILRCVKELHSLSSEVIVNGTGEFKQHGPVADCGTTGRKLAVDFYGGFCRIGGGSPWTKDGSKADLTLNIYARYLAVQYLKKKKRTGPVFCDIACCIGKREIDICLHDGKGHIYERYTEKKSPQDLIKKFKLNTPIYAKLCREGLFSEVDDAK